VPAITRRHFVQISTAATTFLSLPGAIAVEASSSYVALEGACGGRLGVAFFDTASNARGGYRASERFPMCSTFKFLLAGAVLARCDQHAEQLERAVPIRKADLLPYAPETTTHAGGFMTVDELCRAAVTLSDNTAANLLLASIGGPSALTAFLRNIGDPTTRLDRNEPMLNTALANDPRDTTTPEAIVAALQRLALGSVLQPSSRDRLTDWLQGCTTGSHRIRAAIPSGWQAGDKTGTGDHGTAGDVAILWPPNGKPILLAVYVTGTTVPVALQEETIASAARLALRELRAIP
jgi:beta-lactamase class A